MKNKTCYVINFYLGERRKTIEKVNNDKLFLLKKQIEYLYRIKTSIDTIVFNFNIRPEDYHYITDIFRLTPKFIQGSEIIINLRENYGMSYGAWSDIYKKYQDTYNYYIFNEDDYFFVEDNWDDYLIKKFNSLDRCGYLCMVSREGQEWCDYKKHAGHATGISSYEVLNKVFGKYGELPHSKKGDYHSVEQFGQVNQSNSVTEFGYEIYDVRDDYKVEFAMTNGDKDIWRFFWWNKKFILKPILLLEDEVSYVYWESYDDEFKPYKKK